jgi:hypothetical protein
MRVVKIGAEPIAFPFHSPLAFGFRRRKENYCRENHVAKATRQRLDRTIGGAKSLSLR